MTGRESRWLWSLWSKKTTKFLTAGWRRLKSWNLFITATLWNTRAVAQNWVSPRFPFCLLKYLFEPYVNRVCMCKWVCSTALVTCGAQWIIQQIDFWSLLFFCKYWKSIWSCTTVCVVCQYFELLTHIMLSSTAKHQNKNRFSCQEEKFTFALSIDRRASRPTNNGVPSSGESERLPPQT